MPEKEKSVAIPKKAEIVSAGDMLPSIQEAMALAVLKAREEYIRLVEKKQAVYEKFMQISANIDLFSSVERAKQAMGEAEESLRAAGLKEYEATKNLHPFPGVNIQAPEKPLYDSRLAFKWAQEHNQALIPASLDKKEFEALVRVMKVKPNFVTMKEEAKATLVSDMAKALEGVGE